MHFEKILKKEHKNMWVAISADKSKVVGFSASLKDLTNKIKDHEVSFMKVLPEDVVLAP